MDSTTMSYGIMRGLFEFLLQKNVFIKTAVEKTKQVLRIIHLF